MATKHTTPRWNRQRALAAYMKKQVKSGHTVFLIVLDDGRRFLMSSYLFINIDGRNRLPEAFGGMDLGSMYRAEPGAYKIDTIEHHKLSEQEGRSRQQFVVNLLGKALLIDLKPTHLLAPVRGVVNTSDLGRIFQMDMPDSAKSRLLFVDNELVGLFTDDPISMSGMRYDLLENGAMRVYIAGGANERQEVIGICMQMQVKSGDYPEHLANPLAVPYLTTEEMNHAFSLAYTRFNELQEQVRAERAKLEEAALAEALIAQGVTPESAAASAATAAGH